MHVRGLLAVTGAIFIVAGGVVGCSSDDDASPPGSTATDATAASTSHRAAVDLSQLRISPVPAGAGVAQASATEPRVGEGDEQTTLIETYTEQEYLAAGEASTYSGPAVGPEVVAATGVPYVTRVVVRRPADPATFSGRVVVEPYNTSGGAEADVVWSSLDEMIEDSGDAWIGVTVRASSMEKLQSFDAVRYADVEVPTNDVGWDILRQVGALLKQGDNPMLPAPAEHLYMAGFSQSGIDVATFAIAFNDATRMEDGAPVYSGYLPAGHSASLSPLQSGSVPLPPFEYTPMGPVDVPVVDLETQTDVEGFTAEINPELSYTSHGSATVRRPDSDTATDKYRLYELPGAAHASDGPGCDGQRSTFPKTYFMRGAAAMLFRWAEQGEVPTPAPRIDLASLDTVSVAAVDADGNAVGGLRSPFLDVPLARYAAHSTPGALCALSGQETPLGEQTLTARYGSVDGYLAEFSESLDATIDAGHLRREDREALVELTTAQAATAFGDDGKGTG